MIEPEFPGGAATGQDVVAVDGGPREAVQRFLVVLVLVLHHQVAISHVENTKEPSAAGGHEESRLTI